MKARWLLLVLLCACSLFASRGTADAARVLVVLENDEALALRLVAELNALGVTATRGAPPTAATLDALWVLAREQQSSALIWIEPQAGATRLWVLDRVTAKALRRELPTPSDPLERDALIATSAVELLRASFLELEQQPSPRGEAPVSAELAALLPKPSRIALEIGVAAVGSPRGLGAMTQLSAGLRVRTSERVSLVLAGFSPLYPSTLRGGRQQGSADLWSSSLLLSMRIALRRDGRWLVPYLGIGALGTLLIANGRARAPYESHRETIVAAGPAFELGARRAITDHLALRVDFTVARTLSRMVIHLADETVARWGAPLFTAGFGIDMLP